MGLEPATAVVVCSTFILRLPTSAARSRSTRALFSSAFFVRSPLPRSLAPMVSAETQTALLPAVLLCTAAMVRAIIFLLTTLTRSSVGGALIGDHQWGNSNLVVNIPQIVCAPRAGDYDSFGRPVMAPIVISRLNGFNTHTPGEHSLV